jgi:hypothetical protein
MPINRQKLRHCKWPRRDLKNREEGAEAGLRV